MQNHYKLTSKNVLNLMSKGHGHAPNKEKEFQILQ